MPDTKAKHTPSHLTVTKNGAAFDLRREDGEKVMICLGMLTQPPFEHAENVQRIVTLWNSTPDLLAAAEAVLKVGNSHEEHYAALGCLGAAIAKAKGDATC